MTFLEISEEINKMTWEEVKQGGSDHYKSAKRKPTKKLPSLEMVDLYRMNGSLRLFALNNIMKYANRNSSYSRDVNPRDLFKIIHYACMLVIATNNKDEEWADAALFKAGYIEFEMGMTDGKGWEGANPQTYALDDEKDKKEG